MLRKFTSSSQSSRMTEVRSIETNAHSKPIVAQGKHSAQSPSNNANVAKRRSAYLAALQSSSPDRPTASPPPASAPRRAKSLAVRGSEKCTPLSRPAHQAAPPVESGSHSVNPVESPHPPLITRKSLHARFTQIKDTDPADTLPWHAVNGERGLSDRVVARPPSTLAAIDEDAHTAGLGGSKVDERVGQGHQQMAKRRIRTDEAAPKEMELMEVVTSSRLRAKKSGRGADQASAEGQEKGQDAGHKTTTGQDGDTEGVEHVAEEKQRLGHWQLGLALGSGANGIVKVSRNAATGRLAAIKVISKLDMEPTLSPQPAPNRYTQRDGERTNRMLNYMEREIAIMRVVEHDNILRLWDVYEDVSHMYLLLEYIEGGELFDYLTKRGRLSADETSYFFKQMVAGVGHLHQLNIVHRDLKPENILITRKFQIKVADFGLAAFQAGDLPLQSSCGSPHYAAPEVVSGRDYDGPAVDVWSVGIMLYACLMGRLPFDSDDELPVLLRLIQKCQYYLPKNLPPDVADLITRMLRKRPGDRMTMAQITEHTFCKRTFVPTKADQQVAFGESLCSCDEAGDPLEETQEIDMSIFAAMVPMLPHLTESHILQALQSDLHTWEKVLYWHLSSEQASHRTLDRHDWSLCAPTAEGGDAKQSDNDWYRPPADPGPSFLFEHDKAQKVPSFRFARTAVPRGSRRRRRRRISRGASCSRHTPSASRKVKAQSLQPKVADRRLGAVSRTSSQRRSTHSEGGRFTQKSAGNPASAWVVSEQVDDGLHLVIDGIPAQRRARAPHWTEQSTRLQTILITRRQAIIDTMAVERYDTRTLYQPPEPSPWFHDREASAAGPARRRWPFSPYARPKGYDYTLSRTPLLLSFAGTLYQPRQHSHDCADRESARIVSSPAIRTDRQLAVEQVLSPPSRPVSLVSARSPMLASENRQLPPTPSYASPEVDSVGPLAPSPIPATSFASPALDGLPIMKSPLPSPHLGLSARALPAVPSPNVPPGSTEAGRQMPKLDAIQAPPFAKGPLPLPPLPKIPLSPGTVSALPLSPNPQTRSDTPASVHTQYTQPATPATHATPRLAAASPRPSVEPAGPRTPRHQNRTSVLWPMATQEQPRRSLAVRPSNIPDVRAPLHLQGAAESPKSPSSVASAYTPKLSPDVTSPRSGPTPLLHPQPRRVYERPSAPVGGRTPVTKRTSVFEKANDGASENVDILAQLLSPTAQQSPFKRPPSRQMQLDNRGPRPAPLALQPMQDVHSPLSSAHSEMGSSLDTPSLSVIVTPALGFFDPTIPKPVLQELKGAIPRRGWMDKALGHKALYYELLSPQDTASTRDECRRVLTYLGAVVQVEDAEGWGSLKVHSNEIRDVSGVLIHKSVRLKIGFMPKPMGLVDPLHTRSPPTPRSAGYRPTNSPQSTIITVMMERGSADAFNAVYTRLKSEYGLNATRSFAPAYPSPYDKRAPDIAVPIGMRGPPSPQLPEISSFDAKKRPGELFSAEELAYIHRT